MLRRLVAGAAGAALMLWAFGAQAQQSATNASRRDHAARDTTNPSGRASSVWHSSVYRGYTGISFGGPLAKDGWATYPTILRIAPGSPAEKGGLMVGDTILAVNGVDALKARPLLGAREPGDTLVVRIRRGEELREYTIVSTARPKKSN